MGKDSSVPLMYHDPSDLGSLVLIWIIPKERTQANKVSFLVAWVSGFSEGSGGGADTKALRRVFRPLDEHDASPQIVANQNNLRSCNCHVSDDRCERYELKLHTQLHCDRLSKQNIMLSTTERNSNARLDIASLQEENTNLTVQNSN